MMLGKLAWITWVHWFRRLQPSCWPGWQAYFQTHSCCSEKVSVSPGRLTALQLTSLRARDRKKGHQRCHVSSCSHGKTIWLGANVNGQQSVKPPEGSWNLSPTEPYNDHSPCQHTDCNVVKDTGLRTNIIQRTFVSLYHILNKKRL